MSFNSPEDVKRESTEIVKNKLYFYVNRFVPKFLPENIIVMNFDIKYKYTSINKDFGPLDIGCVTEYCREL